MKDINGWHFVIVMTGTWISGILCGIGIKGSYEAWHEHKELTKEWKRMHHE